MRSTSFLIITALLLAVAAVVIGCESDQKTNTAPPLSVVTAGTVHANMTSTAVAEAMHEALFQDALAAATTIAASRRPTAVCLIAGVASTLIRREVIYDSGVLYSGEQYMSHTLANCEDHHFKYPLHRVSGYAHIHFFGISQLSFGSRDWKFQTGDVITISSGEFSAPLSNTVVADDTSDVRVINVVKA